MNLLDDVCLTNLSPLDGRYFNKTTELKPYFTEFSLIKYRIYIEIEYFIELCDTLYRFNKEKFKLALNKNEIEYLRNIYINFSLEDAVRIKQIERDTNHDVKAIEYFLSIKIIKENVLSNPTFYTNFIHFGLTSNDINSNANILMIKDANTKVILPFLDNILGSLKESIIKWDKIVILSRTHGQPASPSFLGKEIMVFYERISIQLNKLKSLTYTTKFGGAVGNFNAHYFSVAEIDWIEFADTFIEKLNLKRNKNTTQIDHYDNYGEIFDILRRINTIFIDLCRDIWQYISNEYFTLKIKKNEVGSSTMPHKVNPINFENAEGNFLLANTLFQFFSNKLPISRLQRDLTDSTVLRNLGVAYGYTFIAYKSLLEGLNKLEVNTLKLKEDLDNNYNVVTEGIQSRLKVNNIENSYELIKKISRTHDKDNIESNIKMTINELDIDQTEKDAMCSITPDKYTGKSNIEWL